LIGPEKIGLKSLKIHFGLTEPLKNTSQYYFAPHSF